MKKNLKYPFVFLPSMALGFTFLYLIEGGNSREVSVTPKIDLTRVTPFLSLGAQSTENFVEGIESDEQFRAKIDGLVAQKDPGLSYVIAKLYIGWLSRSPENALTHLAGLSGDAKSIEYEAIVQECGRDHNERIWNYWTDNAAQLDGAFAAGVARIFESIAPMRAYEANFWVAQLPNNPDLFGRLFDHPRTLDELMAMALGESDHSEEAMNFIFRAIGYTVGFKAAEMEGLSAIVRNQLVRGALEKARLDGDVAFLSEVNRIDAENEDYLISCVEILWEAGFDVLIAEIDKIDDEDLEAEVLRLAYKRSLEQDTQVYPVELWERHKLLTGKPAMDTYHLIMANPEHKDLLFPIRVAEVPDRINRYEVESYVESIPLTVAKELSLVWEDHTEMSLGVEAVFNEGSLEERLAELPPDVPGQSYLRSAVLIDSARSDPGGAIELAKEISHPASLGYAINGIMPRAVGTMPNEILSLIDSLPDGSEKKYALESFALFAGELNPREGAEILWELQKKGQLPDVAIQGYVDKIAQYDIVEALEWVDVINDSQIRSKILENFERNGFVAEE